MSTTFHHQKYQPFAFAPTFNDKWTQREWPSQQIKKSPIWASVDLRDGNQALIEPMTIPQKLRFFKTLVACGFKEIEVGFPAAAQVEFDFMRLLIEDNHIPDDVTVQVLVQAREHLIKRTFESLVGVKRAVVHVYNSTSKVQREKVFQKSKDDIKKIAINGAQMVKDFAKDYPDTEWIFQYSPESFTQTEPEFAVAVCDAVCQVWQPESQPVILNLPATVEATTPNVFADQVEYFCKNLPQREHVIISLHAHNDRGCAVAASELGVMAGADRIEGTLFGNGERTGNMDIVTMAMNLYSQGIDPQLDFSNMAEVAQVAMTCTNLPIHPRHPYVGELVFTAFSGSHQDAIKKCFDIDKANQTNTDAKWDVAYLPIDPKDIGRTYQDVVRINSQSGKGGIAYILQRDYGFELPRWLQVDFSQVVQAKAEALETELSSEQILHLFETTYLAEPSIKINSYSINRTDDANSITAKVTINDQEIDISGEGSGALSAFVDAISEPLKQTIQVVNYAEHALVKNGNNTDAQAVAYLQINVNGAIYSGIGTDTSTVYAMLKACVSALDQV